MLREVHGHIGNKIHGKKPWKSSEALRQKKRIWVQHEMN